MAASRQLSVGGVLCLWAAVVVGAAFYGAWHGYGGRAFAVTLGVLAFFLACQLLLAAGNRGEQWARRMGSHCGILLATVPFLAYLIYLSGTHAFTWARMAIAAAYTLIPVLLVSSRTAAKPGALTDYLAMLAIFLPLKLRWLDALWPYPGGEAGSVASMLLALNVALAAFLFVRQLEGIGYSFVWGREAAVSVCGNFAMLAVILIPLGTALRFIRFDSSFAHWKSLPADAIGIFLLTAWPEEFLFRGLLQNTLARRLRSDAGGWFTASVIFGLAHIGNNGVFPNWKYALLAAIAGIFYGRTWRATKSIFPAAVVHTLVDTAWRLLFRTL